MNDLVESSAKILRDAIDQFNPTHIVSMVSGGKDSAASDQVARELGHLIKCRANGFRELYKWLEGCWALVVKADRKTPLVVLPMPEFIELVKQAEKGKASNGIPESEAA